MPWTLPVAGSSARTVSDDGRPVELAAADAPTSPRPTTRLMRDRGSPRRTLVPVWLDMAPQWHHSGAMDLRPYVENIQNQLVVAAEAGTDDDPAVARRLLAPLDSAIRARWKISVKFPSELFEILTGCYFGENVVIRIEDDYSPQMR